MNQWAARHPEEYERRLAEGSSDPQYDSLAERADHIPDLDACRVCGEYLTPKGRTCKRCQASLEEERDAPPY